MEDLSVTRKLYVETYFQYGNATVEVYETQNAKVGTWGYVVRTDCKLACQGFDTVEEAFTAAEAALAARHG